MTNRLNLLHLVIKYLGLTIDELYLKFDVNMHFNCSKISSSIHVLIRPAELCSVPSL